jgi:uncharacterized protein
MQQVSNTERVAPPQPVCMYTAGGVAFYPLEPVLEKIRVTDIAHALSHLCRYNGHTRKFYSVAQHAFIVSYLVHERYAFEGLHHDDAEAYLGDLIYPIRQHPMMRGFNEAEDRLLQAIGRAYGSPNLYPPAVAIADREVVYHESRSFGPVPVEWKDVYYTSPPARYRITPLPARIARWLYLSRHEELDGDETFLNRLRSRLNRLAFRLTVRREA